MTDDRIDIFEIMDNPDRLTMADMPEWLRNAPILQSSLDEHHRRAYWPNDGEWDPRDDEETD